MSNETNLESRSLVSDQRGAIMIMGVFMAAFLVGILYYVIGIGDSIFFRERMQDASDAAAYSAAIMHARGMNILALMNMIMAAVLAILVALKLIATLLIIAMAVCTALSWLFPALAGLVGPLKQLHSTVENIYDQLKDPIHSILKILHICEVGVRQAVPVVSQLRVIVMVKEEYDPPDGPAEFGFVWPIYQKLPVEDDSFDKLCGKAGEFAATLALAPFATFTPEIIQSAIKSAMEGLATAFSSYFCGGSGDKPNYEQAFKENFPPKMETEKSKKCKTLSEKDPLSPGFSEEEVKSACNEAKAESDEMQKARPDKNTASCDGLGGIMAQHCTTRITDARVNCQPDGKYSRKELTGFEYQIREVTLTMKKDQNGLVSEDYKYEPSIRRGGAREPPPENPTNEEAENEKEPPCGDKRSWHEKHNMPLTAVPGLFGGAENRDITSSEVFTEWDPNPDLTRPVCHTKFNKPTPEQIPKGQEVVIKYREVIHILGCVHKTSQKFEIDAQLGKDPNPGEPHSIKSDDPDIEDVTSASGFDIQGGSSSNGSNGSSSSSTGGSEGGDQGEGKDGKGKEGEGGGDNSKSPQKMIEGAKLGTEDFQLRSIIWGGELAATEKGVRIARWYKTDGSNAKDPKAIESLRVLRKISVAQAEYFFDASVGPSEWLWSMNWRARLRRFQLPLDGIGGGLAGRNGDSSNASGSCQKTQSRNNSGSKSADKPSNNCSDIGSITGLVNDIFLH